MKCNICYGSSWVCELCPHKTTGRKNLKNKLDDISAKFSAEVMDIINHAIKNNNNNLEEK